ncbi:flavin-containing monooxygenase [Rhodococcus koreensis]|uniref:Predicted flavoprotein CzcO associated with the cation diffusion facilitator CzcD n=1 Tax=Rhodococcus koreensis TaxID=99653 RepID=A0A1H4L3D3_9NOCA|nr:NAD(P)/FAD-dependent oxidoreductase [Rhodococcus koreensis]SEB64865.1 Predicted flavoprotein CzcO associated with the cation diffusion facilitator CzcD [Rhodococcus koreensis]
MTQTHEPLSDTAVALEAVRARYRAERDKRIRPDGTEQYAFVTEGKLSRYGADPWTPEVAERPARHDVVDLTIIGAGFGGLLAGAFARKAGIEKIRYIDVAGDFGGTWYWNRYPGLTCDVESYLYLPMLEEIGTKPSRKFAPGEEIRQHALAIAERFDLRRDTLFQTEVTSLRWNDDEERWEVETSRDDSFASRYVLISSGPFQRPKLPRIPGIESFEGHAFHTSRWDYAYTGGDHTGGLDGLADKRVAVVGTGATGLQVVPEVAKYAKELFVVQRTPSAIDVRGDAPTDDEWWNSLKPGWQRRRRDNWIDFVHGMGADENIVGGAWTDLATVRGMRRLVETGFASDPALTMELADYEKMEELRQRVVDLVDDSETAAALQPWYRQMCKRPGFSDHYLQVFNQPNVSLVDTDGRGIDSFTPEGFVVDGVEHQVDVIIFATGYELNFDAATRAGVDIRGRGGVSLTERWSDGMRTLHGWVAREFPNLLQMGLLQNAFSFNFTHVLEDQAEHIGAVLAESEHRGDVLIEPTEEAENEWVAVIHGQDTAGLEFQAECTPSYTNEEGKPSRAEAYTAGPTAFRQLLADWWANGGLEQVLTPKGATRA